MHAINDHSMLGMMSFDTMALYEQQKPRFVFKMPRVVHKQKEKFESDELFRRLSRESEVRYTGFRDRGQEERVARFHTACREGHTEIAFVATGTNLPLVFTPPDTTSYLAEKECDFQKDPGKVHIKSSFIMNGVCVRWTGCIDLERLDGVGRLEFDEERARQEDAILQEQLERYNQQLREFDSKRGAAAAAVGYHRPDRGADSDLEVGAAARHAHAHAPLHAAMHAHAHAHPHSHQYKMY